MKKALQALAIFSLIFGAYFLTINEPPTEGVSNLSDQVEFISSAEAAPPAGSKAAKCRRCFLMPAKHSKGIEDWCDARVSFTQWKSYISNSCDSRCASQKSYEACIK